MMPENYLKDYGRGRCILLIKPELGATKDLWLMGDPFLRTYYSIYDMENYRIGLVGLA